MEIFKLFGSIFIDNEKANQSIDSTDKKADGLGGKLAGMIGTAAKWGAGLAAGAGTAVTALIALAGKTAEAADEIDKLSERTGINREELQRWKYAADQSGADVGKLEVGIKKLSDAMDGAVNGNKAATAAFDRLGISLSDLKTKSQSEIFDQVMAGLADMEQGASRNALGSDLLGKSYTELLPLLNAGADGMKDLKNRADELGLVMSEDAVKANVVYGDTVADLKASFGALFMHLSNQFLPILQVFIDFILGRMPQIQSVITVVFGVVSTVAEATIQIVQAIMAVIEDWFDTSTESGQQFQVYFEAFKAWFGDVFRLLVEIVQSTLDGIRRFWESHGEEIMAIVHPLLAGLQTIISTAMDVIKGILQTALAILRGDWKGAWDGIREILSSVWNGMQELLPKLIEALFGVIRASFSVFFDLGKAMFGMVWDGLKSVWDGIAGWIADKVSWLTDKLFFWRKSQNEMGGSPGPSYGSGGYAPLIDGSHASGLKYVPWDGYIAELHKGEAVVPAGQNPYAQMAGGGGLVLDVHNNVFQDGTDAGNRIAAALRRAGIR